MSDKTHFVVVCGYGCDINSPLAPYLGRVREFLDCHSTTEFIQTLEDLPVRAVVLCGGSTQNKSAPGKTEAKVMFDHLSQRTDGQRYVLEENSYTTYDNIQNAADWIRRLLWPVGPGASAAGRPEKCRITIFCEAQRDLSVEMAARHFMRDLVADVDGDIRTETHSWERMKPAKALWKANMMWLALRFPVLAKMERRKKIRLSKNR